MNSIEIGKRINKLRTDNEISKDKFAKDIGITIRALDSYEYGARVPRDEIKIKIAKYFDTTVESIFFT